jgi:hypothetical protein
VDAGSNVVLTGYTFGTVTFGGDPLAGQGFEDIFLAGFTGSGAYLWSLGFGSMEVDRGRSVAVDRSGNLYATGDFEETVDFGGWPLTEAGSGDIFLLKLIP